VADKRTHRAQKKRAKHKRKREEARRARAERTPKAPRAGGRVSVREATDWPVGDCYLSSSWHEHGAKAHGAFVRTHSSGRMAAAFFLADLEHGGITEVVAHGDVSLAAVQGEMARRSEASGDPMLVVEPDLVVKVFETAAAMVDDPPPEAEALRALFGDVDGSGTDFTLLTGTPPPPDPPRTSLFSLLFGRWWTG
jgi:hypothetical protein